MIKPQFWLCYHEAPATDTSIASSCWANTRRGFHLAVPHSFLKGWRDPISFPLSQKRLLSCQKLADTIVPPPFRISNRDEVFVWPKESMNNFLGQKQLRFLVNYQVENFCWSNFARQWILAVMILWTDKNLSQTSFWKKAGKMKGFVFFSITIENSFLLQPSTNRLPCLLLKRVRLLEFGSNWFDSEYFGLHDYHNLPSTTAASDRIVQDDDREIENSWWVKRIEKGCCWIWQGWMLHDNIGAVVM